MHGSCWKPSTWRHLAVAACRRRYTSCTMAPLLKILCAWGCWWEVYHGELRSVAFIMPSPPAQHQHRRQQSSCVQQSSLRSSSCCSDRIQSPSHRGHEDSYCDGNGRVLWGSRRRLFSFVRGRQRRQQQHHSRCLLAVATTTAATPTTSTSLSSPMAPASSLTSTSSSSLTATTSSSSTESEHSATTSDRRRAPLKVARTPAGPSPRRKRQGQRRPPNVAPVNIIDGVLSEYIQEEESSSSYRSPPPGGYEYSENEDTVGGWLRFSERDMTSLKRKLPSLKKEAKRDAVLGRSIAGDGEDCQRSALAVLRGPRLGLTPEDCRKIVLKQPEVLAMGTAGPIESLAWMEQEMGMDREQMRKLVLKQPRVLSSSVQASMIPAVVFLAEELRLPLEKIRGIMQKFPEILNLNVERTLVPKTRWFEETLGMERAQFAKMVSVTPALFGYSIKENMEPKMAWLEVALEVPRDTIVKMMVRWPGLFTCSTERNILPTLNYFLDELDGDREDVRDMVTKNPRLLGASIDRRMRPRALRMSARGVAPNFAEHRWLLAVTPDDKFSEWLDGQGSSSSLTAAADVDFRAPPPAASRLG